MKHKCSYLTGALLLMNMYLLAQDTLHLEVNGLNQLGIKLAHNKLIQTAREVSFKPSSTSWVLNITTKLDALKITITSIAGERKSITLDDFTKPYTVDNNKLVEKNFDLTKNFEILIPGTNPEIKYTILTSAGTVPPPPGGNEGHQPGAPVYDAILLADVKYPTVKKLEILSYYARGRDLNDVFAKNKFLKPLDSAINAIIAQQNKSTGLSAIFSSIGGLDVTTIADGAAKFLVKRVKQELSIAFFERFKKIIDSLPDLQVLFPETVLLLDAIDTEIYDYERYVQNLREAFKQDIELIHHHLPGIIPNHEAFFKKQKELKAALLSGCHIAVELENRTHPGDILDNYPVEYLDELNKNFKGSIETIQLLNASMRDTGKTENSNYWVAIKTLRQMVISKNALRYYWGLVYLEMEHRYGTIQFEGNTLNALLDEVAGRWDAGMEVYNAYKRYVLRYGEKVDAVNRMIKEYQEVPKDSAALERYARYFRTAVDLIEYTTEASTLPVIDKKVPDLHVLLHRYFQIAYSVADLVADISKKNYSAAINEVVKIYNLVRVKPAEASATAATGAGRDAAKKDADTARSILNRLAKYGSFIASVSTAKNSDEVAAAIEAAALPVGSSRIKRETVFNVALNAYVGPFIGYEKIKGVDSGGKINSYGITAPIGVSVSKGNSILFFNSNTRSSSTIFFSLVDIGALTAFRFTNDSTEKIPTVELRDIVSPGIFFSHGFGKTPLSLNIGFQVGPLLRKVKLDENLVGESYSRFSVSIVVDIPVFNLYSRSKL
jgi:hypothetical protein